MKYLNALLATTGLLVIVLNFFVIYQFGLQESRWARVASILIFFSIFLFFAEKKERFLTGAFGLLLLSDLVLVKYEVPVMRKLTFVIVILAYAALMVHIAPFVRNLKTNLYQKMLFVVVLAINTVVLFVLVDMVETKIDDIFHSSLFYFYGIAIILLVIVAFSFSHRYSNKASFFFICAVMGFVLSDISGFIAYYLQAAEFYFPDRLFYLLGLISLVKFSSLEKSEGKLQDIELL